MGLEVPPRRRLSLIATTPSPACLAQADRCPLTGCHLHLGRAVEFKGTVYRCTVAVANDHPHGLAPVFVAAILGEPESEVQRIERTVIQRHRSAFLGLRAESPLGATSPPPAPLSPHPSDQPQMVQLDLFAPSDIEPETPAPPAPPIDHDANVVTDGDASADDLAAVLSFNRNLATGWAEERLAASLGLRLRRFSLPPN